MLPGQHPADAPALVSTAAQYRGRPGELRIENEEVLFHLAELGMTIGVLGHAQPQVRQGSDWVEFDSARGTFRFEQVAEPAVIAAAAEELAARRAA